MKQRILHIDQIVDPIDTAFQDVYKRQGATDVEKIFAAGDIVNGGKTVVEAVAAGKVAAASMIAYLEKKGVK